MTTWTIKVERPKVSNTTDGGFNATQEDTGLRFDDSVQLKGWCPAGSTVRIQVERLLRRLETADQVGFKYFAFDGASTTYKAGQAGSEQVVQ